MSRIFKICLLLNLLFIASCSKNDNNSFVGKKIEFKKNKIEVNKSSFDETSQLDQQINNNSWVQKGGDEFHSLSNIVFKFPMKKKWSFDSDQEVSDDLPLLTEPIAFDGKLYVLNDQGYLYSLNIENGNLEWTLKVFSTNNNLLLGSGSLVISKKSNSLFLHNGSNKIISLNLKTKKINWAKKFKMPLRGSFGIKNNNLFINDFDGNLINLKTEDGNILWKNKLNSSKVSMYTNSRPIIVKNNLINPGQNGMFHILNIKSGNLVFSDILSSSNRETKFFDNNDIISNPIFKNPYFYINSHSGKISAYNFLSFKNKWSVPIGSKNTPIISGKTIFNIDNRGYLYALDRENGSVRWKTKFQSEIKTGYFFEETKFINFIGPYVISNKVVLLDDNQKMYLIDPDNGKVVSKKSLNGKVSSGIFLTDQIIFLYSNGIITSYN